MMWQTVLLYLKKQFADQFGYEYDRIFNDRHKLTYLWKYYDSKYIHYYDKALSSVYEYFTYIIPESKKDMYYNTISKQSADFLRVNNLYVNKEKRCIEMNPLKMQEQYAEHKEEDNRNEAERKKLLQANADLLKENVDLRKTIKEMLNKMGKMAKKLEKSSKTLVSNQNTIPVKNTPATHTLANKPKRAECVIM